MEEKTIEEVVTSQSIENSKKNNSFNYTFERLFETKWNTIRSISFMKRIKFDLKLTYYLSKVTRSENIQRELYSLFESMNNVIDELKKDKSSVKELINTTKVLYGVYNMECNERICALLDAIEAKITALYKIVTEEVDTIKIHCDGIGYIPSSKNQDEYSVNKEKIKELSLSLGIKKS